jgi:hypothetical protein
VFIINGVSPFGCGVGSVIEEQLSWNFGGIRRPSVQRLLQRIAMMLTRLHATATRLAVAMP